MRKAVLDMLGLKDDATLVELEVAIVEVVMERDALREKLRGGAGGKSLSSDVIPAGRSDGLMSKAGEEDLRKAREQEALDHRLALYRRRAGR